MKHVLSRRKKNNSGSTIIIVLLMTSFVLILATLITTTTMVNYRMKLAGSQSSKSFYTAEEAVDEIQAALGKVSVECFNQAYEEQLTKVLSTTKINGSEVVSAIDNKTANVEFRQNYANKLMPKILDLTPLGTATKDKVEKLVEDGYSTASGKVIPTEKAGVLLGRWTNDVTAEKQKQVCDNFVTELNKYIEDKNSLVADNKVLQVMSINDLRYYVTAGTSANTTDLPVYTIKFSDCIVKYMDKATGSYSYITFNGSVGLPDIYINFKEDEKVGTLFFCDYSLVGNKGITVTDGTASISGSAYAGKGTGTGLIIKTGSKLNFKGKYLVCGGSVNLDNGNLELDSSSQLWAMDINVGDNSEFTADSGSKINLEDDLTVDGNNSTVNINDGCYYYGFGYEDGDTAKERPDFSSAIIVNGLNSHVKFGSLGKLYIAGRAYIKFASDRSLATGESISVNTNQGIYLVPTKLMDKGSKNPTIKDDSATTFSATISIDNFFGYNLLDSSNKYISKEYENKTDGKTRVYYYLNFANSYARNQYTKIIYGSDTELENYLKTVSYYNDLSTADKQTYLDEAKELRDYIKSASTAFGTTNSDITGIDYNAPGTYSNELNDDNANDYREVFVDRDNRYSVFNKILAPLKRDDSTPYGNGEIQTELSQIDSKYTFINLSRYTSGDVYGNIINEDAFNKFTSEEGKNPTEQKKAFLKTKDSKNIIVAHLGLGSKIILRAGGSSLNQDAGSNIITIPESGGYCNGVVICDGDVEVDCNFNGIILADGIVTVKSGCEVKNDLFDSSISTSDSKSFWYFVENHKNDDDMKAPNKYSKDIGFKDIFRYWNSGSESDASGGTLSLDKLSYKDMVLFTQWRKYEDISNNPEQTEPEESSSSS